MHLLPYGLAIVVTVAVLASTMILPVRIPSTGTGGPAYPFKGKDASTESPPKAQAPG